jgi:hypothetical protein
VKFKAFSRNVSDLFKHKHAAAGAIRIASHQLLWRPNKGTQHLAKRKAMGQLPENATMNEYNTTISDILKKANNLVYHYSFGKKDYYAVLGDVERVAWLVILRSDGILETAFPPHNSAEYLMKRGFVLLGLKKEITHE